MKRSLHVWELTHTHTHTFSKTFSQGRTTRMIKSKFTAVLRDLQGGVCWLVGRKQIFILLSIPIVSIKISFFFLYTSLNIICLAEQRNVCSVFHPLCVSRTWNEYSKSGWKSPAQRQPAARLTPSSSILSPGEIKEKKKKAWMPEPSKVFLRQVWEWTFTTSTFSCCS